MGFSIETSISSFMVFLQGILSFFSPCVLPIVPLYIGYLAGGTKTVDDDGTIHYKRSRVMLNTLFFVVGISFAFFLLGFGFTAVGRFFSNSRIWFARIGGIIVIVFGLYQLGILGISSFGKEHRLPFRLDRFAMNPIVALCLGFTFSFSWTPCVGSALASVLLMASSAKSSSSGFILIAVYTVGFVIPFLAVGLFTGTLLEFFKKHQKVVQYTVKIGGILLILMGIMMITGWMNGITGYLSGFGSSNSNNANEVESSEEIESSTTKSSNADNREQMEAPDFTLIDQFGNEHTLSDYKGKVVFLNFWATWCGPCRSEMPDIQSLYEDNNKNSDDIIILGVANPKTDTNQRNSDKTVDEVIQFLDDNKYSYPVVMDTTGDIFANYAISALPTTFMIDVDGNVFGYVSGALTRDIMDNIIEQTVNSSKDNQ